MVYCADSAQSDYSLNPSHVQGVDVCSAIHLMRRNRMTCAMSREKDYSFASYLSERQGVDQPIRRIYLRLLGVFHYLLKACSANYRNSNLLQTLQLALWSPQKIFWRTYELRI